MKKVRVKSTKEYFEMPRRERTKFGIIYLLPSSLPFAWDKSDGWTVFEKEIKKRFPIQSFFRITIGDFFGGIQMNIKSWRSNIRNFIKPNHPRFRKAYPRHTYQDLDVSIPGVIFALFLDFWHDEVYPDSVVDWGIDWETKTYTEEELGYGLKEFNESHNEVYNWMKKTADDIENKLPALIEEYTELLNKSLESTRTKEQKKFYNEQYEALGVEIEAEETRIMKEIIDKRSYLWT